MINFLDKEVLKINYESNNFFADGEDKPILQPQPDESLFSEEVKQAEKDGIFLTCSEKSDSKDNDVEKPNKENDQKEDALLPLELDYQTFGNTDSTKKESPILKQPINELPTAEV